MSEFQSESTFPSSESPSESFHSGFELQNFSTNASTPSVQTFPDSYSYEGTFMFEKDSAKQFGMFSDTSESRSQAHLMSYEGSFQSFPAPGDCGNLPQRFPTSTENLKFHRGTCSYPSSLGSYHQQQQQQPAFTELETKQSFQPAHTHSQTFSESQNIFARDSSSGFHSYEASVYSGRHGQLPGHSESAFGLSERPGPSGYSEELPGHNHRSHFHRRPPLTISMPHRHVDWYVLACLWFVYYRISNIEHDITEFIYIYV